MSQNDVIMDSLRTLVILHDVGGFGHALESLGRTPSAISMQIRHLQDEMGVQLFTKGSGR
jgi:DNA-binding transcriptional LysR family regulator